MRSDPQNTYRNASRHMSLSMPASVFFADTGIPKLLGALQGAQQGI